jgi:hypothetical protein
MDDINNILWRQFGAAIDMLENALVACPDEFWNSQSKFWYIGYHTLFWLDYYLSDMPESSFTPPPPFTISEFDPAGIMPDRVYEKEELLTYLVYCRKKCYEVITGLTDQQYSKPFNNEYRQYPFLEMLLYNMRHVQHHTAQLNLLLRQGNMVPPDWVSRAKSFKE